MTDCVFCLIVDGKIPATIVAESERSIAFKDLHPKQPVHVLVVPRIHFENIAELANTDEESLVDLMKLGASVASKFSEGSFRFQFNTGAPAGQTVFHAHGHITSTTPKEL